MTMEKLCFYIMGEDFSRLARSRLLEEDWTVGVRFIVDGLAGITSEHAYSILSGEKVLVGDSREGFDLVDWEECEEKSRYLESLNYLYGDLVSYNNKWWRPYAYVTSFGVEDMGDDPKAMIPSWEQRKMSYADFEPVRRYTRVAHYADNPSKDLVFVYREKSELPKVVLFEKVDSPPLWVENELGGNNDEKGAKAIRESKGRLQERGWNQKYGHLYKHNKNYKPRSRKEIEEELAPIIEGNRICDMIDDKPEVTDVSYDVGYILPDGRFFGCGYMQHRVLAERIYKHLYNAGQEVRNIEGTDIDAQQELEKIGVVTLFKSILMDSPVDTFCSKEITQKQRDTLWDWCQAHKREFPKNIG